MNRCSLPLPLLMLLVSGAASAQADAPAPLPPPSAAPADPAATAPVVDAAPTNELVIERIVAVVDKEVVLLSEVEGVVDQIMQAEPPPAGADRSSYRARRRDEVLDTLIAEKLLEQEIKKLRIEVSDMEVERVIQGTMQQHGLDDAKLRMALEQQGLTFDEYREGMKKQLTKAKIVNLKVKSRIQVTDQEVKSHLASKKARAARKFKVRARHIVFLVKSPDAEVEARRKAERALERLAAGAEFPKLAEEISEGPSRLNGGLLGIFGRGEMVPEFESAAFEATPGIPVGPVRTPFGWHVILVEERVAQGDSAELSEEEERVRQALYEQQVEQAFRRYIDELRQSAYIEVRREAFSR